LLCILAVLIQLDHTFERLFSLLVLLKHTSAMYYLPSSIEDRVASPFISNTTANLKE
jgi:hypothetical protein